MSGFPARVRFRVSSRLPRRGSAVRRARRSGFRRDGRAGGTGRCAGRRGSGLVHVSPQRGTRLPTLLACGKEARAVCGARTPVCRLRRHLSFKTSGSLPTSAHVSCGRRCHVPPETGSSGQPRAGPAHTPRPPVPGRGPSTRSAPRRAHGTSRPRRLWPTVSHTVPFCILRVPTSRHPVSGGPRASGVVSGGVLRARRGPSAGAPERRAGHARPSRRSVRVPRPPSPFAFPHLPALVNQFFKIRVSSSFGSCMP